jgi:hypothetical protein
MIYHIPNVIFNIFLVLVKDKQFLLLMDAVEDYARRWIRREVDQDPELESLSDWVRTIRSLVQERRVGAVTSQRVLKVLFYVNILQCFFVVENFTANAVSVAIGVEPISNRFSCSHLTVRSEPLHDNNRKFLHIPFANKESMLLNRTNLNRSQSIYM